MGKTMKVFFEKLGIFEVEKNDDGSANILNVDIFELGEAKGFDYTEQWANAAIERFGERKDENGYRPPIIVGHNDTFFPDEKPAQGFLDNLKLLGKRLFADLIRIPADLFERLQKGEYPYRSLEIVPAEFSITACALLGGTEPFFKLTPLANFSKKNGREDKSEWLCHGVDDVEQTTVFKKQEDADMNKEELEKFEASLKAQKQELDSRIESFNKVESETKELLAKFKKQDEELKKTKDESFKKEVDSFMSEMVEKGKLTPAMRESLQSVLLSCGLVSVKFDSGEKSVLETIKKFLSDIPETVNFSTVSKEGTKEKTDMEKHEEFCAKIDELKKANPTMKHGDALRKITTEYPELASAYQKFHSANAPKVAA